MHKFTEEDDVVAFYWFKFDGRGISLSADQVGRKLGMGGNSFRMRIGNFKAADAAGGVWPPPPANVKLPGLRNYAKLTASVYGRHKNLSESEMRSRVITILSGQ